MTYEFDEKGKFFTDIISKISLPVHLQTSTHLIQGIVHIRKDERLKDELDREEKFLAITNANILNPDGEILYHKDFVAVHKNQIVWVIPDEDFKNEDEGLS